MLLSDTTGPLTALQCLELRQIAAALPEQQSAACIGAAHHAAYYVAAGMKSRPFESDGACYVVENWQRLPVEAKLAFFAGVKDLNLFPPIVNLDGDLERQMLNYRIAPAIGLMAVDGASYTRFDFEKGTSFWLLAVPPDGLCATINFEWDMADLPGWTIDRKCGDGLIFYRKHINTCLELRNLRHNEWFRQEPRKTKSTT